MPPLGFLWVRQLVFRHSVSLPWGSAGWATIRVHPSGSLPCYSCDLHRFGEVFVVLCNVRLGFPIETVTVDRISAPPPWVGTLRDGAAINKVGIGRHVIVSAKTAGFSDESADVVFFFKRHVVSARSHCVSQRGLCLLGVLRCLQTRPLLHQLQWPVSSFGEVLAKGSVGASVRGWCAAGRVTGGAFRILDWGSGVVLGGSIWGGVSGVISREDCGSVMGRLCAVLGISARDVSSAGVRGWSRLLGVGASLSG